MAMYVAHCRVAVEVELFLATDVVRMIFCSDVSSPSSDIGNVSVSEISADAAVPRLCSLP